MKPDDSTSDTPTDNAASPRSRTPLRIGAEDYYRLVREWTHRGTRPVAFPRRLRSRLVALHLIQASFDPDLTYGEQQVNDVIRNRNLFEIDHVQIRRYMVDYGMLVRESGGAQYRVAHGYLSLADWDPAVPGVGQPASPDSAPH